MNLLVLQQESQFEVYKRGERNFELFGQGRHGLAAPVRLIPARQPDQLFMLCRDGEVQLRQVW